ncbi:hypothetical protein D3C84_846150 [compost metagenome]
MRVPRRCRQFGGHAEGRTISGQRVIVGKVIDHLLQPHRPFRWQAPLIEQAADIGVRAGVDVGAEGRDRCVGDAVDGVVRQRLIFLARLVAISLWISLARRHRREAGDRRCPHTALGQRSIGRNHFVLRQRFGLKFRLGRWRRSGRLGFGRNTAAGNGQQKPDGETLGGRAEEMQRDGHGG